MANELSVGIDVGSHTIKVIAAGNSNGKQPPPVRGTGYAESAGLKHGQTVDTDAITEQSAAALQQASESAGQQIHRVHAAVNGTSLSARHAAGSITFEHGDHTITDQNIANAVEQAKANLDAQFTKNHVVLHQFALAYKVDSRSVVGTPTGMKGAQLAVRVFFITALSQHVYDLVEAVEESGVTVDSVVAGPLAASTVTLSPAQKKAGCVLADIGAETVSIIVFDDNKPVSLQVFPIGSTDITNDIALGLKVPLEKAEQIKEGGIAGSDNSKDKLDDIIAARLTDVFELIDEHLEAINRKSLLPAGIILAGGGSGVSAIDDIARDTLDLPAETAQITLPKTKVIHELENSSWAVAYGTAAYALHHQSDDLLASVRSSKHVLLSWLQQFLP